MFIPLLLVLCISIPINGALKKKKKRFFPGLAVTPQRSPHLGPSSAVGPSVSPVASSAPEPNRPGLSHGKHPNLPRSAGSKRS